MAPVSERRITSVRSGEVVELPVDVPASYVGVGLLSVVLAQVAPRNYIGWAGMLYFLLGPVSAFIGFKRGSARHSLQVAIAQKMPNTMHTDAVPNVAAAGPN